MQKRDILKLAQKNFGFTEFRPGQREAIEALAAKQDCLVVMPTGSGKSAIYQVAALLFEGTAVVISPLIALQKDQVDSINEAPGPDAVVINSAQRAAEARAAVKEVEQREAKYVFLAPEQLRREETLEMLEQAQVSLFVVDEAHCISEWGHDFRPDYLQLGPVIEKLGHPVVVAMTATASPEVRQEIVDRLGMRNPKLLVQGFDRPNIYLRVDHFESEDSKLEALVHRVDWAEKPGIVYVTTRKDVDQVTGALHEKGVQAVGYHGGMKASSRQEVQDSFMSGDTDVIVATNAFGMGVDKPDVRFVYHYGIPDSLDSYYQEIGRAGRDGEKSEAVLFFREQDMSVRKFLSGESKLEPEQIEKVANVIADQEGPVAEEEIADETDLSERKLTKAIQRLEDVGAVDVLPTGELQLSEDTEVHEAAQLAAEEQERHREMKRASLLEMHEYATGSGCRRERLLRHFGDEFTRPCNNCDNCEAQSWRDTGGMQADPSVGTRREVA